jgi:hypothetical protein
MAPARVEGGIASLRLGTSQEGVLISGHRFTCTQEPTIDRCTVEIQELPLEMQVTYDDGERRQFHETASCQTTYDDRPVKCELFYDFATGDLPNLTVQESLDLSQSTIQQLRQENALIQLSDGVFIRGIALFAIVFGLLTALNLWLFPRALNRSLVGLSHGSFMGLMTVFYAPYIPVLEGDTSLLFVVGLKFGLGFGLGALMGMLLWAYHRSIARTVSSLLAGVIVMGAMWYFLAWLLLVLGYID